LSDELSEWVRCGRLKQPAVQPTHSLDDSVCEGAFLGVVEPEEPRERSIIECGWIVFHARFPSSIVAAI
jgi:hypothetical protein